MGTLSGIMQILHFLFNKRLYPVWIAGQICFNMANGGVIAIQDDTHNWGGNGNHEVAYCLIPFDIADPGSIDPKLPDPCVTSYTQTLIPVQPVYLVGGNIDQEHISHYSPYLLYLLKRPPPRPDLTV